MDLCQALIISHMKALLAAGKSAATVNRRRGYFLTLWKEAYISGLNSHEYWKAKIARAREPKTKPVAWSTSQIQCMLDQARRVKTHAGYPFGPHHWACLILLLYYTGLRIKAALTLKRSDLRGRLLIVPPDIQKDAEEIVVQLPTHLVNRLVALSRPCEMRHGRDLGEMLIPWPWRMDHIQSKFTHYILEPAGLPIDRKLKFHAIRKTVATIIAAHHGKQAACDAMGHSSIHITERYLADPATVDPSLKGHLQPMDALPPLGETG